MAAAGRRWRSRAALEWRGFFWAVLLMGILFSRGVNAQGLDFDLGAADVGTTISASGKIVYDKARDEVSATDDVVVDRGALHLTSDTLQLFRQTQTAIADGNVQMTHGGDVFSGSRLELDWQKETGVFYDGSLFIEMNNFHIQADKILRTGENTYFAQDVRVTTCDGESPDWQITGKELNVTYGGYGTLKHGQFKLKKLPIFYSPLILFPAKTERQSGLLTPSFEFSDRKGVQISQPFYWAINESSDATLYVDYISRRGEKLGTEYRYLLSEDDYGVALFDFLEDSKVDDGSGTTSEDWGYSRDSYLRPNSERYWFRMKHDQQVGEKTSLYLDLDVVSDQDYLYEFKKGNSGFEESKALFLSVFHRELDDYSDTVRKNRVGVSTQWPGYSLNAEALWWDDVIARTQKDTDDTVQSLPVVSFDGFRQSLGGTPLYFSFETQSAVLYREDGTSGERIDLYPRLYQMYRLGRMLTIEPSVGGRETLWRIERFDDDAMDGESSWNRELYDFRLDLSSEIYNVYQPGWGDMGALKHVAKFQVDYDYTPTLDQEDYPYFDGVDRIDGENRITYSVVNTLTTRRGLPGAYQYRQALRLELSQSYDLGRQRDNDPEPFDFVEGDLQLSVGDGCRLGADAQWDPYSGEFPSHNVSLSLSDVRGDAVSFQHRYSESLRETLKVTATLKLTDRLWLFPEYERNIKDDHMVAGGLEMIYRSQCWSLAAVYEEDYEEEEIDRHFSLTVSFHGLGSLGGGDERDEGLPDWAR